MRAMDQGGQGRDQVDAVVMPNIRRQRRPFSASCARLQSRQFLANPGDAGADQGLVTDAPEGEADQDRREGREPRPLRRLPDGRGCHPTANVPGDFAAHRGTTAAATPSASMRRSIVMRSRATTGRVRPNVKENGQLRPSNAIPDAWNSRPYLEFGLQASSETAYPRASSGGIWGIPVEGCVVGAPPSPSFNQSTICVQPSNLCPRSETLVTRSYLIATARS